MIMPKDQNNNDKDNNNNNSATFLHAVRAMHFYNDAKEPIPGDRVILFRAFDSFKANIHKVSTFDKGIEFVG